MRIPRKPPSLDSLRTSIPADKLPALWAASAHAGTGGRYLHWDKLLRYPPPDGLSHEEWWFAIKFGRIQQFRAVPLTAVDGKPFQYGLPDPIPEHLHQIDLGTGGHIRLQEQMHNPHTKDRYYVRSLIDEAITSSQLEGATTTRQVAKEMLQTNREPRDRSEQMIQNNFRTMKQIGELKQSPLTKELVFDIHRLVTDRTLIDPSASGRFRDQEERIVITDSYDNVVHTPPPATELEARMEALCAFANGQTPDDFVHPAIRSILLHFWLGYDHPFVDGNGRTARALFYWSMLRHGYWLTEFISISKILLKAPAKYSRSFLYTETDENDLTYFLIDQLEVIQRAVEDFHSYIHRKTEQLEDLDQQSHGLLLFNDRQRLLLEHALRHPNQRYTIESHRMSHNVVYQTARTDLLELSDKGLLQAKKIGRAWHFLPPPDLAERLKNLA